MTFQSLGLWKIGLRGWRFPIFVEHDETIRRCTESGYPCGSDEFVIQLEQKLGRPIRPQKTGRKPKEPEHVSTALLKFSN
jgi:hypothetical protein